MVNYFEIHLISKVFDLLGIREQAQYIESELSIVDVIANGLPTRCVISLIEKTGLTGIEICRLLQITEQLLWGKTPDSPLTRLQSSELFLIAMVFVKAQDMFGTNDIAVKWLRQRQIGLAQRVPLEMLDTTLGIHVVLQFLDRIDHGVYV